MRAVVDIDPGRVAGTRAGGVTAFTGIPYAAAPAGPLRFRPPRHPAPWDDVFDATGYGPTAPVPGSGRPQLLPSRTVPGSAYLNLNVWTPDTAAEGLPVMVWLHGGAFTRGSGADPAYDGAEFARTGVVAVTLNYRIGAEGFALLDGGTANLGLLDQIHALEWVRDNIDRFGGHPGRVTVFGQSAGAMSVVALMAAPRARGLFGRAIAMSGAGHHANPPEDARRVAAELARRAGAAAPTPEALAALDQDRVLAAQDSISADFADRPDPRVWGERLAAPGALPFAPVIDGEVLPRRPLDELRTGGGASVDLLIGTTAEEFRSFLVPAGLHRRVRDRHLAAACARYGLDEKAAAVYSAEHGDAASAFAALHGDAVFRIPAYRAMEARARVGLRVFAYEFAWRSPALGGPGGTTRSGRARSGSRKAARNGGARAAGPGALGAAHGVELPFLFGTEREAAALVGTDPPAALGAELRGAWARFARTGDPGWAAWTPERRTVWRFDAPRSHAVDDPGSETRRLWEGRRG
ncbi:carboxylesterase/lipase family protein [Nocardiopsis coralliicola]